MTFKVWAFVGMLFAGAAQPGIALAATDVRALNQQIRAVGARWIAKDTGLSRLSKSEARRMLGLKRARQVAEFQAPALQMQSNLPMQLDWRNQNGINWVTPIMDQGNCGSCVAFASIATLETQYKIAMGLPMFNLRLSPQSLFSCGGGACEWGWRPESAARFLQRNGAVEEACLPYTSGATGSDVACNATCNNPLRMKVKLSAFSTPSRSVRNIEAVKAALQSGPLVTTLDVYADFMSYAGGIYTKVSGEYLGGHAVSIVGYNDVERYWIIRNSWGATWGEDGFGRVSYDDMSGVGDETWSYQLPTIAGAVSVMEPTDYSYWAGQIPVNVVSTFAGTEQMNVSFTNSAGMVAGSAICEGKSCNQMIDVSSMPEGRYEVEVTAMNAAGAKLGTSARQFFYIAHQKPELTLSFNGKSGLDMTKPLRARVEFAVLAKSSTVPMSSVEFHFRGPNGVIKTRATQVVMDGLVMGWRTNTVPNGNYEIWMTGRVKTNSWEQIVETPKLQVTVAN